MVHLSPFFKISHPQLFYVSYVFQRATCAPPVYLIVLDTCMDEDDLQAVKVGIHATF